MEKDSKNEEIILIKSGDYSMFASCKKGETVLIGDPSSFVYAGVSMKEEERKVEDDLDDTLYSKPAILVKKLKRRINKRRDE